MNKKNYKYLNDFESNILNKLLNQEKEEKKNTFLVMF